MGYSAREPLRGRSVPLEKDRTVLEMPEITGNHGGGR